MAQLTSYSPLVKAQALDFYLYTNKTRKQIAAELKIPVETLHTWAVKDKWPAKRRELANDLKERTHAEALRIMNENRAIIMRRHLEMTGKLEEHIGKMLDDVDSRNVLFDPEDIEHVAKALNSSALISGRVVGLDAKQGNGPTGTPVNVLINTNFTPTPIEQPVTSIDVQPVEDEEDPF